MDKSIEKLKVWFARTVRRVPEYIWTLFLLTFTGWGTWAWMDLVTPQGAPARVLRMVAAVVVTDGAVLWWQYKYRAMPSKSQRALASVMSWLAVGLVMALGVLYAVFLFAKALVAWQEIAWLSAMIEFGTLAMIAGWAALNLAVAMQINRMDPESQLEVEKADQLGEYKRELNRAFSEASVELRPIHAMIDAIAQVRDFAESKGYSPAEVNKVVKVAERKLNVHYGEGKILPEPEKEKPPAMPEPVEIHKNGNGYHAETVTPDPTPRRKSKG